MYTTGPAVKASNVSGIGKTWPEKEDYILVSTTLPLLLYIRRFTGHLCNNLLRKLYCLDILVANESTFYHNFLRKFACFRGSLIVAESYSSILHHFHSKFA